MSIPKGCGSTPENGCPVRLMRGGGNPYKRITNYESRITAPNHEPGTKNHDPEGIDSAS